MLDDVRAILRDALQLGDRADNFTDSTPLLGSIAEFDSMAVVTVLTMMEERYGLAIDDDEISAEVFESVGSLRSFLEQKASV